jgi:hypothetical protein
VIERCERPLQPRATPRRRARAGRCPLRRAWRICGSSANLRRTIGIAVVVGTILSAINELDVLTRGDATTLTWVKIALNFVVPFCVANVSVLVGAKWTRAA